MKKLNFLWVLSFVLFAVFTAAQNASAATSWQLVGDAGFSAGRVYRPDLTFNSKGTAYVLFRDDDNDSKATVMKYESSKWQLVGKAGFTEGAISSSDKDTPPKIEFDSNDTPYIAFKDDANKSKISVMKFNGSSWGLVGSAGFSKGSVGSAARDEDGTISLAFDKENIPYVAFKNNANYDRVNVMKFVSNNWVNVGKADFSAMDASYVSMAVTSKGVPYVAFTNGANAGQANVMKFDGKDWVSVGKADFSPRLVWRLIITLDSNDTPYVSFNDSKFDASGHNQGAVVMKFNGKDWVSVGEERFSPSAAILLSLAFDSKNTPYVAYLEADTKDPNFTKPTVMKYSGSNWSNVCDTKFSSDQVNYLSLDIGPKDVPHVAFADYSKGWKATVMKDCSDNNSTVSEEKCVPSPIKDCPPEEKKEKEKEKEKKEEDPVNNNKVVLKKGSIGNEVLDLQKSLIEKGYLVGVIPDGKLGTKTIEAINEFQKLNGKPVGGPITPEVIGEIKVAEPVLKQGSTGPTIVELQQDLIDRGYLTGIADGTFSTKTTAAIKAFQRASGQPINGVATTDIIKKIEEASIMLKSGSTGPEVLKLQQDLIAKGYLVGVTADGKFGSKTVAAVREFQKLNGKKTDGIANVEVIGNIKGASKILKQGATGPEVVKLQQALITRGYLKGKTVKADGKLGANTVSAIKLFQRANGQTQTGVATVETIEKLEATSN